MTLSLPLTRLYSPTSALFPDSRPAYYTFLIALFYESPAHHLMLPHLTSHDPISTPDSSLFAYLSLVSGFSARLLYFSHSLVLRLILTLFLVTFTRESVPQYMTPFLGL